MRSAFGILARFGAAAVCLAALWTPALAGGRVDVPITQTVLPNGDIRYAVPVAVGDGPPFQAALDTGSFGLRVLARALTPAQYERTTMERRYGFGGGARFVGVLAKGRIAVGEARLDEAALFQLIESVDCLPEKPKCPASRLDAKDYGIAGDGYAGAGFDAILGISMRRAPAESGANNPLTALGDARWLVRLPRPGEGTPGHLIVNPGPEELAGFTMIPLAAQGGDGEGASEVPGWRDAALYGCLSDDKGRTRVCGRTLMDSGAPGVTVETASSSASWSPGTSARLSLSGGDRPIDIPFTVGADLATRVRIAPAKGGDRISAGTLPYMLFDVLYDQKAGRIGLKARDDR